MYISLDKETQQVVLKIPPKYGEHATDLMRDMMEEFRFDALNNNTLIKMNDFITTWFTEKGIDLSQG